MTDDDFDTIANIDASVTHDVTGGANKPPPFLKSEDAPTDNGPAPSTRDEG